MDDSRIDALAKILSQPGSRRNALRLAIAGAVGGSALAAIEDAETSPYNVCLPRCQRLSGKQRKRCIRKAYRPWCWVDPPRPPLSCGSGTYAARYFGNTTLSGTPVLERCETVPIFHDWGYSSPGGAVPADNFSATWTSSVFFTGGSYDLYARADDGIRVWFGSQLVIDRWSGNLPEFQLPVNIVGGTYTVRVEYREFSGYALVGFRWVRVFRQDEIESEGKKSKKKSHKKSGKHSHNNRKSRGDSAPRVVEITNPDIPEGDE